MKNTNNLELQTVETVSVDLTKVNYLLNRPSKLLGMLPDADKERLSAHVGRRFSPAAKVGRHQKR
jgi:hypothetical protein